MNIYTNRTALITGASSGIGEEFAQVLASNGMNLVLVARSEDKLRSLASEITARYGVRVEVVVADLSRENAALEVRRAVEERAVKVDWLINNAGFTTQGHFENIAMEQDHEQAMLNVVAVVDLTHAFLPDIVARQGAIINVASTTSFYPLAYQAVYGASKAFVLSLSEALWAEYRDRGVRVLALCPGLTSTKFKAAQESDTKARSQTPQQVVAAGLRALERGQHYTISGAVNYWETTLVTRLLPRAALARFVETQSAKFWSASNA